MLRLFCFVLVAVGVGLGVTSCLFLGQDKKTDKNPYEGFEVGEIAWSGTSFKQVISVDNPIVLPNCQGTEELSLSRTFTKEINREVKYNTNIKVGIPIPNNLLRNLSNKILNADIEVHGSTGSDKISQGTTVTLKAAPGTSVTYQIEWYEISTTGVIELRKENEVIFQEFSVPSAIEARILEPVRDECNSAEE